MRRSQVIRWLLGSILVTPLSAQITNTPNLGLNVPPSHYQNWQIPANAEVLDSTSHGTCAIAVANGENLAFVIDSAVIQTMNRGVSSIYTHLSQRISECKVWSPTANMLASTTGLIEVQSENGRWGAQNSGKRWLASLTKSSTPADIDQAMRGWGRELIDAQSHVRNSSSEPDGEIGSLFVIFKTGKNAHIYKERIIQSHGQAIRDFTDSPRLDIPEGMIQQVSSGSCRNFIQVNGFPAPVQPTPAESIAMNSINSKLAYPNIGVEKLESLLLQDENQFAEMSNNHAVNFDSRDEIGPPYQLAHFSNDAGNGRLNSSPRAKISRLSNPLSRAGRRLL
ncbi:hypothetical protein [Tunturiibacter gelidiferens]|uniref:hypothetical protein n=1 Tax=Tunturiibacter gelidiferens TaxID=3069689 RepID=UPI003D9B9018